MNRKTVGKPLEIDQRACKIFQAWLPDHWLPREQKPDFFVDYVVEIVEDGEPTGRHFAAQVKGFGDKNGHSTPLSYSFKTKHLKYYLDQNLHPVFLFLIDTTSGDGYWLFAQKFLQENLPSGLLNRQKSYAVPFSREDSLKNNGKFIYLLPEAERFVRDLHPGSVQAAIRKRKAELEAKDPRCNVSVSFKGDNESVEITAKQGFSFVTRIKSENVSGWRDFFERGREVKFKPGEVEFVGAPLLQEAFSEKTKAGCFATMRFGLDRAASVELQCGTGEKFVSLHLDGKIHYGTKFATLTAALPNSILEIKSEFSLENRQLCVISVNEALDLNKWNGKQILFLPYFDKIRAYIHALSESEPLKMEVAVDGNTFWTATSKDYEPTQAKAFLYILECLFKSRSLAAHFSVNPVLPQIKTVSQNQWDSISIAYGMIKNEEVRIPYPDRIIKFVCSESMAAPEIGIGHLKIASSKVVGLDFFGTEVPIGPFEQIFTSVKLASRKPLDGSRAEYEYESSEKSWWVCRPIRPSAGSESGLVV